MKEECAKRFIIDGKHEKVPELGYILLNAEKIPSLGDAIYICWENEQYEWDVVVDKSIIIESKLDTTRFNFSNFLPKDDRGIPPQKKFTKD